MTSSYTWWLSHTYESFDKLYIYLSAKKEVTELTSWLPQWLYLLRQWSYKILNCMLNRLAFCNYALADMKQKRRHHGEKWRHHASIWRHHDWIWRHHDFFNPVRIQSLVFFFFLLLSPLNGVSWRLSFYNFQKWSLIFTQKRNRIGWKYFLTGCHDHWLTRFDFFIFAHLKCAILQISGHINLTGSRMIAIFFIIKFLT